MNEAPALPADAAAAVASAAPQSTPAPSVNRTTLAIASDLGETDPKVLAQLRRIVKTLDLEGVRALLVQVDNIEAAGGWLVRDKSRRRTRGGIFLELGHVACERLRRQQTRAAIDFTALRVVAEAILAEATAPLRAVEIVALAGDRLQPAPELASSVGTAITLEMRGHGAASTFVRIQGGEYKRFALRTRAAEFGWPVAPPPTPIALAHEASPRSARADAGGI